MSSLEETRTDASRRLALLAYPTRRDEDWRFTNVNPIARTTFVPAPRGANGWKERLPDLGGIRLVFVGGRYAPELSTPKLPAGLTASFLSQANGSASRHLGRYASYEREYFVARNTAEFEDGAFVEIPAKVAISEPIHLVFLSAGAGQPTISQPRSLVLIGEASQATLVETYLGYGEAYFTNAVTEIVAGDRSVVEHYKVQAEDESAFHVATVQSQIGQDASFSTYSLSFGGRLVRNDINAVLSEGSSLTMNGLYVAGGEQHVDHHTTIDHAKPHATSHEFYKGILNGRSSAVFNGRILVRLDAQKTDSKQSNNNLVLSEDATINTKPELQILADDVRCTHGATIGQLDAEAVFYLQSRGIDQKEARGLLTQAFARDILDRVKVGDVRGLLEQRLAEKLHDGRN